MGVGLQSSQSRGEQSRSGAEGLSVGSGTPKKSVRSRGAVSWEWDSKAVSPEQRVSQLGVGLQRSQSGAEGSQLGVGLQSSHSKVGLQSQSGAEGLSVGSGTPKQSVRSRGAVSWESKAVSGAEG